MVFSSIPTYLDPTNWQQQLNHQIRGSSGGLNPQLQPPQPPPQQTPPQPSQLHGGGGSGSIRPGSMSDRARMANIPMPEAALKCPRCESTNTKFCYFNNYSLTQPRHFCKTCRRYWTRGGALRSVPVGGGCRRNKRSKGSGNNNSKSPASSGDRQTAHPTSSGTSSMISNSTTSGISAGILGLTSQIPQLRLMSPLSQLTHDFGSSDIGMNYAGNSAPAVMTSEANFHIGSSLYSGGGGSASVLYPFQGQQFSFLGGLDQSGQGLFSYGGGGGGGGSGGGGDTSGYVGAKLSNSMLSQVASVKMEDHNINNNQDQSTDLARQFMGVNQGNNDQWSGSAWTDLSGFSSSSTSNPL